jgi:hypothetical protein
MSKIIAIDNFETQNWAVSFDDIAPHYADLLIGFTNEAVVVEFIDLQFKYELRLDGNIMQSASYPLANEVYIRTDQPYIVVERLFFNAETEYELYIWAMNDNISFEHTVSFITPKVPESNPIG